MADNTSNKKKPLANVILGGISWKFATRAFSQIQRLTVGVVLARLLSPEDFGLIAMVTVLTNFIALFRTSSLASALIQKQDIDERHISSIFWLNVFVGVLLTGLTVALSPLVGNFYGNSKLVPLTAFVGLTFVTSTLSAVPRALLSRNLDFRAIEVVKILSSLGSGLMAIVLVLRGMGVWALAFQLVLSSLIYLILVMIYSKWSPKLLFSWSHAKECFGFGFSLQGAKFVEYFSKNLDNLLIGKYISAAALGFYDKAYQFMLLPFRDLVQNFNQVLYPTFSTIQNDREKLQDLVLQLSRALGLLVFPLMLGLIVLAPEVIRVLYGEQWGRSAPLLQILCIGGLMDFFGALSQPLYLSQGRADLQLKLNTLIAVVRSIGFFIGLRWGVEGVAMSYVVVSALLLIPVTQIPLNLIGLRLTRYFKGFAYIGFASAVMALAVWGARWYLHEELSDFPMLLAATGIGGILYLGLLLIGERSLLMEIYHRIRRMVR